MITDLFHLIGFNSFYEIKSAVSNAERNEWQRHCDVFGYVVYKKNIVLVINTCCSCTLIIVSPDSEYLNYFGFKIRIMNKIFSI